MTVFDPTISNGTCYWKAGAEAGSTFLPCGNVVSGKHFTCCSKGDNCLTSGACFNMQCGHNSNTRVFGGAPAHQFPDTATYVAACTDPYFTDDACPNKGDYSDQHWVGLVSCNTAADNSQKTNKWVGCKEPDLDHLTQPLTNCKCDATKPALFYEYNTIESIGRLPTTSGGTLSYFRGFAPTDSIIPVSTSTHSSATASATSSATSGPSSLVSVASPTSTVGAVDPTATPDGDSDISTGVKAGIGAGAALGAVSIFLIVVMAFRCHKRRRDDKRRMSEYYETPQLNVGSPNHQAIPLERNNTTYSGLSGYKAELAADTAPSSAVEAVSPLTLDPPQPQDQQKQYQAYHPDVYSRCSVQSNISGVSSSPVASENAQTMAPSPIPLTARPQHSMDIIAELEG